MVIIRKAASNELEIIRRERVKAYEEDEKSIPTGHWETLKKAVSSDTA